MRETRSIYKSVHSRNHATSSAVHNIGVTWMRGILIVTLLVSSSSMAVVYECGEGKFQAIPCNNHSKPVNLKPEAKTYEAQDIPIFYFADAEPEMAKPEIVIGLPPAHPCEGVKISQDAIRFRELTLCMTEEQMLKIAGPQQFFVYEYIQDGRRYKQYKFTAPRAGLPSAPLVESGYVVDIGSGQTFTNSY